MYRIPQHEDVRDYAAVILGGTMTAMKETLKVSKRLSGNSKVCFVLPKTSCADEPPILVEDFNDYPGYYEELNRILEELVSNGKIDIMKNTSIEDKVEEGKGEKIKLRLRMHAFYVDEDKCDNCGDCYSACPVKTIDHNSAATVDTHPIAKTTSGSKASKFAISRLQMPYCQANCGIYMDVRGYIGAVADDDIALANEIIAQTNPLPAVCGTVCTHLCESTCARNFADEPLLIKALKGYAVKHPSERGGGECRWAGENRRNFDDVNKIAVIGSGPAGLAAAQKLAVWGYPVTIFEAQPVPGGMLSVGIPNFRMAEETVMKEVNRILDMGVELKLNSPIGENTTIDNLMQDKGYKAIFIAAGAHESIKLRIEGEELPGVYPGMEFLRKLNLGEEVEVGKRVSVIGGGNVAVDAARAAKRSGAEKVTIIYRRSRSEMPAYKEEMEEAEEEGIELQLLTAPTRITADDDGKIKGVECIKMVLGEPDESGRRRPKPIEGTEHTVKTDTVIAAIGQSVNPDFITEGTDLDLRPNGTIVIDEQTGATNIPGVFAGGDVSLGPASVIEAIRDGSRAAAAIDAYLSDGRSAGGTELDVSYYYEGESKPSDLRLIKLHKYQNSLGKGGSEGRRVGVPELLPASDRIRNFDQVEQVLDDEDAKAEAQRCLACRLCIGCGICAAVCPQDAVDYKMQDRLVEIETNEFLDYSAPVETEIIPSLLELYRNSYNVITAKELEAMLVPESAFGGLILRPFDGEIPGSIVFVNLSAGEENGASSFKYLVKLAKYVKNNYPEIKIKLFTDKIEENIELEDLGEDLVEIADLVIEEDGGASIFKISYSGKEEEIVVEADLIVLKSILK